MTNYLLLYFKVHLSKLAEAQVLLQVNKRLLIHWIWESQQLCDSNQQLNFVFYLLILHGSQQGSMSSSFWPCWQSKIPIPSRDTFEFSIWLAPQLFTRVVYPSPPLPLPPPPCPDDTSDQLHRAVTKGREAWISPGCSEDDPWLLYS